MQIPLKWINDLINIDEIGLNFLIEKLTLGGFEVEEIIELQINNKNQITLDISTTANRSDSLSIQGFSIEIGSLLNYSINISSYLLKTKNWTQNITKLAKIGIDETSCFIFSSVVIKNITNTNVPKWIIERLISSGITPLNNLIDFQNYILLETGYPFAFYDLKKICSKLNSEIFNLSISKAKINQEFLATNGLRYYLDNSILLINVNKEPLSIAGIIENQEFSYSKTTNSLLIEGSIFNAAQIRQQSRRLGLRTERSTKYEKSLKNTYILESLYRLISLLRISNPNLVYRLHTISKNYEKTPKPILLKYQTINEILGPIKNPYKDGFNYITPENVISYLKRLNLQFLYDKSKLIWEVDIPHLRTDDLIREIDLIEEIGRLHGFNNFFIDLPKIKTIGIEDPSYKIRSKIRYCLLSLGFNELVHYSLIGEKRPLANELKLINPLLSDCSSLRSSLLPNLLKTVQENLKQANLLIEGFEYGHVFLSDSIENFKEKEYIAGIFGGIKTRLNWSDSEIGLTWFEAKGKIEQLLNQLNLLTYWKNYSTINSIDIFHPYRCAQIFSQNEIKLGIFGQLNPIIANQLNISNEIYLFEFDIELIQNQIQSHNLVKYKKYSYYPKIKKNLSFMIQNDVSFNEIKKVLYLNGTKFLSEINLLDEYKGQLIPKNYTSLCLQLVFQSYSKTLKNKEIDNIINQLNLILNKKFEIVIRK